MYHKTYIAKFESMSQPLPSTTQSALIVLQYEMNVYTRRIGDPAIEEGETGQRKGRVGCGPIPKSSILDTA